MAHKFIARRFATIEARWSSQTYHARILSDHQPDSKGVRATSTSGHEYAARACAAKYFAAPAAEIELKQTGGDGSFTGKRTYDVWHAVELKKEVQTHE